MNKTYSDAHSGKQNVTGKHESIEGDVGYLQTGNNAALYATLVPLQPL
jgi:hypothetical protein